MLEYRILETQKEELGDEESQPGVKEGESAECTHELTMNITTHRHRTPNWLNIRLLHQNLPSLKGRKPSREQVLPSKSQGS